MKVRSWSPSRSSHLLRSAFCTLVVTMLAIAVSGYSWAQRNPDQALTLKGISAVWVSVDSVMPEALAVGLNRDSLAEEVRSILRKQAVPLGDDRAAELRIDVLGFVFGSRLSFSAKMTVWQAAVLVTSGDTVLAETWSDRRDSEADGPEFVDELRRLVGSQAEEFAEDFRRVNASP